MATSKFSFSLILAFLTTAVTLVTASPLSPRQEPSSCIVPLIVFTSIDKPFALSVQNKTHPEIHNYAVSYASESTYPSGPVEHYLAIGRFTGPSTSKFRLTEQKLYHSPPAGIPEQIPAYSRSSKYKDLYDIYFPATASPEPPSIIVWHGYYGCNEDTGAVQLELGSAGIVYYGFCAKKHESGGYRLYMKTSPGDVGDCLGVKFAVHEDP